MSGQRIVSAIVALVVAVVVTMPSSHAAHAAPTSRLGVRESAPPVMTMASDLSAQPPSAQLNNSLQAGPRAASTFAAVARPQREVFGFVNAFNLGDPNVGYPSWNFQLLTTVAYFALHVNSGDGNLITYDTGWAVYHSSTMMDFVATAHANGVRVIASLNLHDFGTSPDNQVCQGLIPANAQNTINQAVAQVRAAGIDGINVNYEGSNTTCRNGLTSRDELVAMIKNLRAAMPWGYLAIDTYSGSAEDNLEFFNVTGLAPYVDSMFVMAYDMDYANFAEAPLNCASYCFNPVSPLNTYRFNVTKSMAQYTALVPSSKVILGQPYYGSSGCVGDINGPAHMLRLPGYPYYSPRYLDASTVPGTPGFHDYVRNRDPGDHVSEWDVWGETGRCAREQYWDDPGSLGAKYALVNQDNLGGVGLFTLDYAGGAPEVWNALAGYFSLIPGLPQNVSACASNSSAVVSWTAASTYGGPITSYQVTAAPGGATISVPSNATMASLAGLTPGTSYTLTVRAVNSSGPGVGWIINNPVIPVSGAPLSTSYFTWYDHASPGVNADTIHIVNPGSSTSSGCVTVSGVAVTPFTVDPGHNTYVALPAGAIGGPAVVSVLSGPPVLASLRAWYYQSLNEIWARPASAAATTQYFPWYDLASPGMQADTIHITNVSGSASSGTIALPGATSISFSVANGQDSYFSFPYGTIGGPVTVTSSVPVLASLRGWYNQSFNETLALPGTAAATTLYLPWYDLSSPGMNADTIHITNPGATTATGTIALPGASNLSFSVMPGHDAYYAFPSGTIGGPATISSSQPVLATLRAWYYQTFNETAARPATAAATTQRFAWYDLSSPGMRADTIHITNVSGSAATGTITLGGATISFSVANGQDSYYAFPGGSIGGPVTITSSQPVLASLRAWYYQSFNEVAAS